MRIRRTWIVAALAAAGCGTPDAPPVDGLPPTPAAHAADSPSAPVTPVADSPAASTADSPLQLGAGGWGPLRIGMTRAEVVAAAGEDANPEAVGGPDPEACDEFRPKDAPEGMRVMLEQGRLTRISVARNPEVRTPEGFGVGTPAAGIREGYGARAAASPHKYLAAPAEYLTVWTADPGGPGARGIVYEIGVDGSVAQVHAGSASIQYVEGCL